MEPGIMYAVIETSGRQYKVQEGETIEVDRFDAEVGAKVTFDKVLLAGGDGETRVGTPTLKGATVTGEVCEHIRGPKLIIFKMRRRQDSKTKRGFRSHRTTVKIAKIKA